MKMPSGRANREIIRRGGFPNARGAGEICSNPKNAADLTMVAQAKSIRERVLHAMTSVRDLPSSFLRWLANKTAVKAIVTSITPETKPTSAGRSPLK